MINTLSKEEQNVLIYGTISHHKEENIINEHLKTPDINIIIYDKMFENRPFEKYNQLTKLGFTNVYIYPGGLFNGCCFKIFIARKIFLLRLKKWIY